MPTAEKVSTVALAESARRIQVKIRNAAIADIAKLWPLLNFGRIDQSWDPWLRLITPVLTTHHAMSADAAALFYRAARQHATGDPGPVDLAKLADPPLQEWVARARVRRAWHVRPPDRGQVPPEQANKAALAQTLGTTSRIVLDGGRTTIEESVKADPVALGYLPGDGRRPLRVLRAHGVRGVVNEANATHGSTRPPPVAPLTRFTGEGLFKFHNGLRLLRSSPAFSARTPSQLVADRVRPRGSTARTDGSADARSAFRKAWKNRAR
jgi:hypothetical protein